MQYAKFTNPMICLVIHKTKCLEDGSKLSRHAESPTKEAQDKLEVVNQVINMLLLYMQRFI